MANFDASTCTWKILFQSGVRKIGAWISASLNFWNETSHSSVHSKTTIKAYKGWEMLANQKINLWWYPQWPIKPRTCFELIGLGNSSITFILYLFVEMPFLDTMWPKIFPCQTMKTHLSGFKHRRYKWHFSKINLSLSKWSALFLKCTRRSSTYTSKNCLRNSLKMWHISFWKVVGALVKLKGKTKYLYSPNGVEKLSYKYLGSEFVLDDIRF